MVFVVTKVPLVDMQTISALHVLDSYSSRANSIYLVVAWAHMLQPSLNPDTFTYSSQDKVRS